MMGVALHGEEMMLRSAVAAVLRRGCPLGYSNSLWEKQFVKFHVAKNGAWLEVPTVPCTRCITQNVN